MTYPQPMRSVIAHKSPYHIDIPVGKVNQPEHAIDHGITQGDQGIDGAPGYSISELLNKFLHILGSAKTDRLHFTCPFSRFLFLSFPGQSQLEYLLDSLLSLS